MTIMFMTKIPATIIQPTGLSEFPSPPRMTKYPQVFDYVVSATGYTGTKQLFPHCISAITPITDLHVHNAYMMGYLIHAIMEDNEKMASWNAIASHKPEFRLVLVHVF